MGRLVTRLTLILCVFGASAGSLHAQTAPPIVNRPGATLLLPYFEVDLSDAQGLTTVFSVNNASATAVLAHVTLWSDLGVPVFAFNVYLTGYDMQTIDLREVFNGTAPRTASAGQDPQNTISPQGQASQDINFASCNGRLPPPAIPETYLTYLRSALSGGASSFHGGQCVARNLGTPDTLRGYVTVDTVNNCTLRLPGEPGYFGPGGTGDVTNQNVLYGDYQYVNPGADFAVGEPLVGIVASATDPETSVAGEYTFYGRLVNWTAADNREPLAASFAARYVAPKDFKTPAKARRRPALPPSTDLLVWRDPKHATTTGFACGSTPAWYPLGQEAIRAFDEQEGTEAITTPAQVFPAATQRVSIATSALPISFASGWLYLNLNATVTGASTVPPEDPAAAQAWVTVIQQVRQGPNGGNYEVGYRATRLDSARSVSHLVP